MEMKEYFRKFTAESNLRYVAAGIVALAALLFLTQSPQLQQPATDEMMTVDLKVDYGDNVQSSIASVRNGSTAFHVLNSSHKVNYTEYSFGYFVTGIDGVQQNATHSWLYFVNEEPATEAVNKVKMSEGNELEFRFINNNRSEELLE